MISLQSFLWPDQLARLRLLRGAIEVARGVPAHVDEEDASARLRSRALPSPGIATVVFHSIVLQYLDEDERRAVDAALRDAGERATEESPFAYLRMEPSIDDAKVVEVRLKTWPGDDVLLAHTGYHGTAVRWLGGRG